MPLTDAERPALIVPSSGVVLSHRALLEESRRIATLLHDRGLRVGDHIATLLANSHHCFTVAWAAQRSGLYYTPVNHHLTPGEAAYIVADCGAKAFFSSGDLADLAGAMAEQLDEDVTLLSVEGPIPGFESLAGAVKAVPLDPAAGLRFEETEGAAMYYSSGTTGRPKGIIRPLPGGSFPGPNALTTLMETLYRFDAESVYLSPAPLYHAAPLAWSMATQRIGGTTIVMDAFDAERALELIAEHRVTNAQFVPTMFIRMLKLPPALRERADISSMRAAIHAAAPCPVEAKRAMIEWWGEIIEEFYAGSEGNGFCSITSAEWLGHPGSVGRAIGSVVHIVDDDGAELGTGEVGTIYFEGGTDFSYHNDAAKTAEVHDRRGWTTLGDVGRVDSDGYLYLTDRKSHMIIAGGVNIYPQEIEDVLAMHPAVLDVAVIGVPNHDLGEEVKAIVKLIADLEGNQQKADELVAYCWSRLARFKCPRSIEFVDELPRLPTGKLAKRLLRDQYTGSAGPFHASSDASPQK